MLVLQLVAPTLQAESSTGYLSDVNNAVIVDAGTDPGEIVLGDEINGTIGHVFVRNLSQDVNHTLVSPEGTEVGPSNATNGTAFFPEVPLYEEGTWEIQQANGETVSRFAAASEEDLLGTLTSTATVQIDQQVPGVAERAYEVGFMDVSESDGPQANCIGDDVALSQARTFDVWAAWDADLPVHPYKEYGAAFLAVTEYWDGEEYQKIGTTVVTTEDSNGTVSVMTEWEPGKTYVNRLYAFMINATTFVDEIGQIEDDDSCLKEVNTVDGSSEGDGAGSDRDPEPLLK